MEKRIPFSPKTRLLEIGAGDGKATWDMYVRWGSRITALEPGPALWGLLRKKFSETGVRTVRTTFEEFIPEEPFDCVVSATAFHWVKEEVRYTKTAQLLSDRGYLVLFWNNYSRNDDPVFDEIQEIYRLRYPGNKETRDIRDVQREMIDERRRELEESGHFTLASHSEYLQTRTYTAKGYVDLLKTFSKNSTKGKSLGSFYATIENLIRRNGDRLDLPIHVNLEIGQKDG